MKRGNYYAVNKHVYHSIKLKSKFKEVFILSNTVSGKALTQEDAFTKLSIPKVLVKFVVPAVLSQLVFLILNLADAFFVGRTEDTYQISAMTITFPLIMMLQFIATTFGVGANANMAAELGKGNRERAKHFSSFAIWTAVVLTVIYSFGIFAAETPLLTLLGADENSIGYCKDYLFYVLHLGCVPIVLLQAGAQLFMAEGETKISSIGVAGAGIINIILDPIFIFPLGMGVAGAALATFIANLCALVFYGVMLYRKRKTTVVCLNPKYYKAGEGICGKTLAVGIPAGLVMLFNNICDFTRNANLKIYGGQVALAAWGVVQKIGNAFMQICVGIAQGVRSVLSYNYSAGYYKRTKSIISASMLVMAIYTVVCVVITQIVPDVLVSLFIPNGESAPVAAGYLRTWIFCMFGIGFIELFNSVFQALGKWKISMANTIINKGVLLTPVMLILTGVMGINGILISQPITESVTAIALAFIYIGVIKKELSKEDHVEVAK